MSKITTAGYALLGVLAVRARSTYELVQYMKESNLKAIWSRAESQEVDRSVSPPGTG